MKVSESPYLASRHVTHLSRHTPAHHTTHTHTHLHSPGNEEKIQVISIILSKEYQVYIFLILPTYELIKVT